jgi:hypothetical protein
MVTLFARPSLNTFKKGESKIPPPVFRIIPLFSHDLTRIGAIRIIPK